MAINQTAIMLSIAGSDCSAGAGLQADMKAGHALGSYVLTALTCAVSEVPGIVQSIIPMSPDFVAEQIQLCLDHYPVGAIKTGMLYSPAIVEAVGEVLKKKAYQGPIVLDPVMIATAGTALMQSEALEAYEKHLIPRAHIITPNIDELCVLAGKKEIRHIEQLREAAQELAQHYNCAILAKGGHLEGEHCIDILARPQQAPLEWKRPKIQNVSTHGTGCTLSSAVAALLAGGQSMEQAVEGGLNYVTHAISESLRWEKSGKEIQALAYK